MEKVSVIIPSYNRFKYLLVAIQSIQNQTYKNIEIIVINDASTEREYYEYDWNCIKIIHLDENSGSKFGFACAGHVRNQGIPITEGKYIAFCDDDDSWFPTKIELQMEAMKNSGCKMSSTDGLIGKGMYNPNMKYAKYNSEYYYTELKNIYRFENGFPNIWNKEFLNIHNCIICSSVILEKEILVKINGMKNVKNGMEDYDCWIRALEHTDCVYVNDICFYYDMGHGYGNT